MVVSVCSRTCGLARREMLESEYLASDRWGECGHDQSS